MFPRCIFHGGGLDNNAWKDIIVLFPGKEVRAMFLYTRSCMMAKMCMRMSSVSSCTDR